MTPTPMNQSAPSAGPAETDLLAALTDAAAAQTHPRLLDWYGEDRLRANLASGLDQAVSWIDDEDFGAGHRDGVAVIDVPDPMAWANRRLTLPDGSWAVTGIRFRRRDLAKPFVEIVGSSLPVPTIPTPAEGAERAAVSTDGDYWPRMVETIWSAYAPFGPGRLQLFAAHPEETIAAFARLGWHAEVDMYLVAGQIDDLRTRPRAARFEYVALRPLTAAQASALAENTYAALVEQNPASALWALPQSPEEFTDYAAAGMLFGVHVDDRLAGVVAAARRDSHGLTGFSVEEIVLDADHRGQRLAGPILQHLLDHVPGEPGDVLWGTIHPDNRASLRNAQGIGREIVGANLWVCPPGWPAWPETH